MIESPAPPAASRAPRPPNLGLALVRLLRVKQWTKNLLVFAAWIFTGSALHDSSTAPRVLVAFFAMCFVSSATYVFNDVADVERDRAHPKKRLRPIASGAVSIPLAVILAVVLMGLGLAGGFGLTHTTGFVLVAYLALQVLYNAGLKRAPVADVFTISLGFILRAALGAAAISVTISSWLLFCTAALALMLGFAKRRSEFIQQGEARAMSRESLAGYTRSALDALVIMFACGAALCYGVYAVESTTAQKYPGLILTSLFVFYGISRYVLVVFSQDEGGEPETLLFKDRHILFSIAMFVLTALLAMSGLHLPLLEP